MGNEGGDDGPAQEIALRIPRPGLEDLVESRRLFLDPLSGLPIVEARVDGRGPVLFVLEIVYSITDPPIMFVRRFVPPLRLGAVALDTSFIIVLIVVYLLRILVSAIFFSF